MATSALFFIFAGLAIACAVSMVYHKNPLYSAISLIGVFISLSCIYVTLAAPFIAAVQVLIYAGAIMVLVVFVIMLLNLDGDQPFTTSSPGPVAAGAMIPPGHMQNEKTPLLFICSTK